MVVSGDLAESIVKLIHQREAALISKIEEDVIGTDEWNPLPKRNNYVGIRNKLRATQRAKLNSYKKQNV